MARRGVSRGKICGVRGYAVSTVGFELNKVTEYIDYQEQTEIEQEAGRFYQRVVKRPSLRRLKTVKPPALRMRYDLLEGKYSET